MSERTNVPPLRLHKQTGRGRVWINGKEHYCGTYGTPECRAKYDQLIAEFLLSGRAGGPGTLKRLIRDYTELIAPDYPVGASGQTELTNIKSALAYIPEKMQSKSPASVTIRDLHDIREDMRTSRRTGKPRKHRSINRDIRRVVEMFRWGFEAGKVPYATWHALTGIKPLRNNSPKVKAVPEADLYATLDAMNEVCADLCRVLLFTAMRVGELCRMRWLDVDQSQSPWEYVLTEHKTAATIGAKSIWLNSDAQAVLVKYRDRPIHETVFVTQKGNPYKPPVVWTTVRRACEKAGVAEWTTHQLRHNAAGYLRVTHGIEVARDVLGHSSIAMTDHYSHELRTESARRAMMRDQRG